MTTGVLLPEPDYRHWETNQWGHAVQKPTSAYTADQMREYAALVAEHEREEWLQKLTRADWRPSSIFRHYYPSSNGDWVDLRELTAAIRARGEK